MNKVAFHTLGCKLNYSETSSIVRMFEDEGYQKVAFDQSPDIYVINTCSVTENADKKCKKLVKEALSISPHAFITIIGCYAQLKPEEIAAIPGVSAVLGAAEKFKLLDLLDGFRKKDTARILHSPVQEARHFYPAYSKADRTRTFLKVQDGCSYSCSFCTIPLARGESRSDTIASVVRSAKEIAATSVKEVVLTGVNIGDFGWQSGKKEETFLGLVKALDEVEGIERFRISSIEPNLLNDEIISYVSGSKRFVPHFHIPLQSGSNKILKLMRRRYLRELYADRVHAIKSLMPDCCIGVDVIVGFPGESREDFMETYQFLNEMDISYLHVFPYSERANTKAAEMEAVVPPKERQERSGMLRNLSEKKRRKFYETQLGTEAVALFEAGEGSGTMYGFTNNYVRVATAYNPMYVNQLKAVKLKRINAKGFVELG